MPAQPSWFIRVPEIISRLSESNVPPFLDRAAIENLFGLRRRQAIRLMTNVSGYQLGKTFLVDRDTLIAYLRGVEESGVAPHARQRKMRVLAALNEAARQKQSYNVRVKVAGATASRVLAAAPEGIQLIEPGRLQITYTGAEDLLARIVELATSATNDFEQFRAQYERCV